MGYAYLPCITFNEVFNQQGSFRYFVKQKQNSRLFYSFGQENIIVHGSITEKMEKNPTYFKESKYLGRRKELQWPELKAEQGSGAGATHHMQ